MSGFGQLLRGAGKVGPRKPPSVFSLKPSAWADSWADKPQAPVNVGIRRLAEDDIQAAKSEAARLTQDLVIGDANDDDRISTYNDALMRVAVARGACSAEDVSVAFFALGELQIRERMTPEGVRALWDAILALHVSDSPLLPELDNEGFAHLIAMWDRGVAFEYLDDPGAGAQLLRLLEHVRQQLEIAEGRAERAGELVAAG